MTHQAWDNCYLHFYYDYNDEIIGFEYFDGTTVEYYTYVKNMQGDVVAIINSDGVIDTTYEYDAWGRSKGSSGNLDVINPIRYRGYYYDEEISMYYLQSRYYDPMIGRFINADDVIVLMLFKISNNQYAYCNNNPIIRVDPYGYESITVYGLTVTLNSNGFSVDVNWIFFSKVLCLEFAEDVIELAGDGKKYKKMRRARIAQELLAHALLYFLGEGMLRAKKVSDDIRKYFSDATIKKVLKKFAKIYSTIGEYLYLRSKTIDVNNNEKWYRMLAFKALWYIYPTF